MITGKLANVIGKRFGHLFAKHIAYRNKQNQIMVKCLCDCGNSVVVNGYSLIYGATRSCGCWNRQMHKEVHTKHDMCYTRFYHIWQGIKNRCYNSRATEYKYYGGRGIIMCPTWKDSFASFYKVMQRGYNKTLTIDRIDNNGHYCPFNCRWVAKEEQMRNSRQNKWITINGQAKPLYEWLKYYGIKRGTYGGRVFKFGWTPQKALTTPVRHFHRHSPTS